MGKIDDRKSYLAVDLGASSGRVMAGWLDGDRRIVLEEVRRFENMPVERDGVLCWDMDGLLSEIAEGLKEGFIAARDAGRPVASIGVDSWAVDFGLVDESGELTGPVVHYRDARTEGMMERVFEVISQREIFARTGIQFLPFNTIYQLAALKERDAGQLERARHFMMIADLVAWWLTGAVSCEYTNATTTQLFDARGKRWSGEMLERLGLPVGIFPEVVWPGSVIGKVRPELALEWGVFGSDGVGNAGAGIQRRDAAATLGDGSDQRRDAAATLVIAVATHDTGSAVAAVPAEAGKPFAYLSCGTWSLLGTELGRPVLNEEALAANFTNEGGAAGTIRFLKNIMGLWILQECRREWARQKGSVGTPARDNHSAEYGWSELEKMAREADAAIRARGGVVPVIDVDDPRFMPPGDMPGRVIQCCAEAGFDLTPDDHGAIAACVLRSLAARYREVFEKIEELTVQRFERLYVVGGGVQNRLLLEWTREALGRDVVAGPVEATALGNIGIQMIAAGELRDLAELRSAVR